MISDGTKKIAFFHSRQAFFHYYCTLLLGLDKAITLWLILKLIRNNYYYVHSSFHSSTDSLLDRYIHASEESLILDANNTRSLGYISLGLSTNMDVDSLACVE
jgi:hypothetical protein